MSTSDSKDQEIKEILSRDQQKYPQCTYSRTFRQSCSNDSDGEFTCKFIRQIERLCPGKQPVQIYLSSKNQTGENSHTELFPFRTDRFEGFPSRSLDRDANDIFRFMDHFLSQFGIQMMDPEERPYIPKTPSMPYNSRPPIPPHKTPSNSYGSNQKDFENQIITGPEEDI